MVEKETLHILLVDDMPNLRSPLADYLRDNFDYHVSEAGTYEEAIRLVNQQTPPFDVTVLDDMLVPRAGEAPKRLALKLMLEVRDISPHTEVIILTGWGMDQDLTAIDHGAFRFLSKSSFDPNEIGHLIRQAAEFGRLKRQSQNKNILEKLIDTTPLILSNQELPGILESILQAIHEIGYDRVRLYLLSEDETHLIGRAQIGMPENFVGVRTNIAEHPNMMKIIEAKMPMLIQHDADSPIPFAHDDRLTHWGCIPLISEGKVIGKVGVDNMLSGRRLQEMELRPLAIFAGQVAAVISRAQAEERLEKHRKKREAIQRATQKVRGILDLNDVLIKLCQVAVEQFDVDHSAYVIFDDAYQYGKVMAEYPAEMGTVDCTIPVDTELEKKLIFHHEPMQIENVFEERSAQRAEFFRKFDIHSQLIVPSIFQGKVIGSFGLDTINNTHQFSSSDVELFTQLATQAAIAVHEARLFEAQKRLVSESPIAVIAVSQNGLITQFNQRASDILACSVNDAIGKHLSDFYAIDGEYERIRHLLLNSEDGSLREHKTFVRTQTGKVIPVRASLGWTRDALGKIIGAMGHFEDISYLEVQKRLQDQSKAHQRISEAIQSAHNIQDVYYLILTGITASFGLRFNRAALFECEDDTLIGRMGIGYLDEEHTRQLWRDMEAEGIDTLEKIKEKQTSGRDELDTRIAQLRLPFDPDQRDMFSAIIASRDWRVLTTEDEIKLLPDGFVEAFEPKAPLIVTALRSEDGVIGLLVADNKFTEDLIDADTQQSFLTLASSAAIAISKAQLIEQTRQQAEKLEDVNKQVKQMGQADGEALIEDIIRRSVSLLDAKIGCIFDYDESNGILKATAEYPENRTHTPFHSIQVGHGMVGKLVESGKPYDFTSNYAEWPGAADLPPNQRPYVATLDILLRWRDEIFGVLHLEDDAGREFDEDNVRALLLFAEHAAIAIKNLKSQDKDLLAWETLRSSFEAGIGLAVAQNPEAVVQMAIRSIQDVNLADRVAIVLLDNQGRATALHRAGADESIWHPQDAVRKGGISFGVKDSGQPYICQNVPEDPKVNPIMRADGTKAAICLPFIVNRVAIGAFWAYFDEYKTFTPTEVISLQLFANQAAAAFDQKRKMETLRLMHEAAEVLSGTQQVAEILEQIVQSAAKVLQAQSAALWAYDDERSKFVPDESVAIGIEELWDTFQSHAPKLGQTAYTVMERDYVAVEDATDYEEYSFLGNETRKMLARTGVKSFQGITLRVDKDRLGVLYLNYDTPREFTPEDEQNVRTFANHAAMALKQARLLYKLRHALDTAKLVARLSVDRGLDETLEAIVEGAKEVLDSDAVVLYPYNHELEEFDFQPQACGIQDDGFVDRDNEWLKDSLVGDMLRREGPYMVTDVSDDPIFEKSQFCKAEGIKSLVAIPLQTLSGPQGVLFVNHHIERIFTTEELDMIQLFADQAAVVIQDARLYAVEQRRTGTLRALNEAGRTVTSTLDLKTVLNEIALQAWKLASLDKTETLFCSILLVDEGVGKTVAAYPPEKLEQIKDKVGEFIDLENGIDGKIGITGRSYRMKDDLLIRDVEIDKDYLMVDPKSRSAMVIRIRRDEEIIGFIVIEHERVNAFNARDRRSVRALAAQASAAIQNARRVEEMKSIKGYVGSHNAVKWMEMVSLTWGHTINRIVGEAKARLFLIERRFGDRGELLKELDLLKRIIEEIEETPLTEPLTKERQIQLVDLHAELNQYFGRRWEKYGANVNDQIALRFELADMHDAEMMVRASPAWLRQLFEIISENAIESLIKHNVINPYFLINTHIVKRHVILTFEDNGVGVSSSLWPTLFEKPVEKRADEKGAGIGLMQAAAIVQTYGGLIEYDEDYQHGARFLICLPLAD